MGGCGDRESHPNKKTLELRPQWEVRTAVSIAMGWGGSSSSVKMAAAEREEQ